MSSAYIAVDQKIGSAYECACDVSFKHSSSYSRHQRRQCCTAATQRHSRSNPPQMPQRTGDFEAFPIVAGEIDNADMRYKDSEIIDSEASERNDDDISSLSRYSSSHYVTSDDRNNNTDNSFDKEVRQYVGDVRNDSAWQDGKVINNEYPDQANSARGQGPWFLFNPRNKAFCTCGIIQARV